MSGLAKVPVSLKLRDMFTKLYCYIRDRSLVEFAENGSTKDAASVNWGYFIISEPAL